MTSLIDTSSPRRRFQRWTRQEQDFWIDMLDSFASQLLAAHLDPEKIRQQFTAEQVEIFAEDIRIASELADVAVQEMQYRFEIQKPPAEPGERKKRKRQAVKTR